MRITLMLDNALLEEARQLTGIHDGAALVRAALRALIAHEAARRLAALGGTMPDLDAPPRRRLLPRQRQR